MVKCNITHSIFFIGLFCTVIVYTGGEDPRFEEETSLTYTTTTKMPWVMPLFEKYCSFDGSGGKVPLDGSVQGDPVAFIGTLVALMRSTESGSVEKNNTINKFLNEQKGKGVILGGKVTYIEGARGNVTLLLTEIFFVGVPKEKAAKDIGRMRHLISNNDVRAVNVNFTHLNTSGINSFLQVKHSAFDYIDITANIPVSLSNVEHTTYITCSKRSS